MSFPNTMLHALHGNFGLPADWTPLRERLNLPGGFRAWHLWETRRTWPKSGGLTAWAERFCRESESTDGAPGVLCGYSLGARLALHALRANPAQWRAAVLLAPHPGLTSEHEQTARREADAVWAERCLNFPWTEVLKLWNAQPVLASGAAAETPAELEHWKPEIASAFRDWSTGAQENLRPFLQTLNVPVLWLTGGRDAKFTALAAECAALNPRVVHLAIPDAGHRLLRDAPDAAAEAMESFLKALPE